MRSKAACVPKRRRSRKSTSRRRTRPDFALLFLPTEGLYAEILRRPGLTDFLQREYRVSITGPTTLTALLNSLQWASGRLRSSKRSSEVWQVLGAVKTEFRKFGDVLAKTRKQLETVTRSIELAETRTRQMSTKLRDVEALPGGAGGGRARAIRRWAGKNPTTSPMFPEI